MQVGRRPTPPSEVGRRPTPPPPEVGTLSHTFIFLSALGWAKGPPYLRWAAGPPPPLEVGRITHYGGVGGGGGWWHCGGGWLVVGGWASRFGCSANICRKG